MGRLGVGLSPFVMPGLVPGINVGLPVVTMWVEPQVLPAMQKPVDVTVGAVMAFYVDFRRSR